jgi:hypothetical protein
MAPAYEATMHHTEGYSKETLGQNPAYGTGRIVSSESFHRTTSRDALYCRHEAKRFCYN